MPKLYVANATQQNYQFNYWLPGTPRHITEAVPLGGQIQIAAGRDLSNEIIDDIIRQHRVYGICTPAEAQRNPNFSGIVYSVDRPVSYSLLLDLVNRRRMVLVEQGKRFREEAAIATDVKIIDTLQENQMPGRLRELELSVEEVSRDPRDDSPEVSEGVRVTHKPEAEQVSPARRGRERAAARRAART